MATYNVDQIKLLFSRIMSYYHFTHNDFKDALGLVHIVTWVLWVWHRKAIAVYTIPLLFLRIMLTYQLLGVDDKYLHLQLPL